MDKEKIKKAVQMIIEEIDPDFFMNSVRTILASVLAFDKALDVGSPEETH